MQIPFHKTRKPVSTIRNEKFVHKYVSARQKYLFLAGVSGKFKKKKNDFHRPKIQFPRAEIRFLLKRVLRPNFKFFNKALLNKAMLFLLDRKFVSTSQNEEFVKKTFLFEGETVFTYWNIWQMGKTVFH